MKKYFLDVEPKHIAEYMKDRGNPSYRTKQILAWVYSKKIDHFEKCSDVPADLRSALHEHYFLRALTCIHQEASALDGTIRYNFRTRDDNTIPTVFLPQRGRNVVCISTQMGCSIACGFCKSGKTKFVRNLSRGEIIEQVLQVEQTVKKRIDGVLLMGMGEPLLNYSNVVSALKSFIDRNQCGIGRRHITLSTVGCIAQMKTLMHEKLGIRLALSLHAADDQTRMKLVSRKAPFLVKDMVRTGIQYARHTNTRLTIEYMLIDGLNDTLLSAKKLVKLIKNTLTLKDKIQVNLIPYNPTDATKYIASKREAVFDFKECLTKHKILTTVREARGLDIGSACGQLSFSSDTQRKRNNQ